jgi:hypothetical protein
LRKMRWLRRRLLTAVLVADAVLSLNRYSLSPIFTDKDGRSESFPCDFC